MGRRVTTTLIAILFAASACQTNSDFDVQGGPRSLGTGDGSPPMTITGTTPETPVPTTTTTATTAAPKPETPLDLNALAELMFIDEAEHLRIEAAVLDCMNGLAFEYNVSPYWPWDMFEGAPWRSVTNPPPEIGPTQAEQDAYRDERWDVSRAQVGWEDAFFGTGSETITVEGGGTITRPTGGCLHQGTAAVVGDTTAWTTLMELAQVAVGESWSAAEATPEVQAAAEEWSACMQQRGYNATSFEGEGWGEQPGAEEAFTECVDESEYSLVVDVARNARVGALLQEAPGLAALVARLNDQDGDLP